MNQQLLKVFNGPHAGGEIVLDDGDYLLGSGNQCDIVLTDPQIASEHCRLTINNQTVTFEALSAATVFVEGRPEATGALGPYEFLTVGDTHVAVGPNNADWPSRELPTLQAETPDTADVSNAGESSPESPAEVAGQSRQETASTSEATPTQPLLRRIPVWGWAIVVVVLWLGGSAAFVLSGSFGGSSEPPVEVSAEDIQAVLDELAVNGYVSLDTTEEPWHVSGHVKSKTEMNGLEERLEEIERDLRISLIDTSVLVDGVRQVLASKEMTSLRATSPEPGMVMVSGKLDDTDIWETDLLPAIREGVPRLDDIQTDFQPTSTPTQPVPPMIADTGTQSSTTEPSNNEDENQSNAGTQNETTPTPAVNLPPPVIELPEESPLRAILARAEADIRNRFKSLTRGGDRVLTLSGDVRLREGSPLGNGVELKEINRDHVVLSVDGYEYQVWISR